MCIYIQSKVIALGCSGACVKRARQIQFVTVKSIKNSLKIEMV